MKITRLYILGFATALLLAGCAKAPQDEINAAQTSIAALNSSGMEKYAPDDAKRFNDQMEAINQEIKAQDEKFIKDYDKAKQMLAQLQTESEAFKPKLEQIKEQQKNDANMALNSATQAIADAKAMLANAPAGKGSKADIEAMTMDLKGLEESVAEIQNDVAGENYLVAIDKANNVSAKAGEISAAIQSAMDKMKGNRK